MGDVLKFTVKFEDVEQVSPEFSKVSCRVLYTGKNRNNSSFTKESVEEAIPSLLGVPVIGEFIQSKEDFGGHGGKLIISDDGIEFVMTTVPYGFVSPNATTSWETIEDDGVEHEYLVVNDIYLWTGRYPDAQYVVDSVKNQSMEINLIDTSYDDENTLNINKFTFSALCILGNDVTPCFESASIGVFALNEDEFKKSFNEMTKKVKELFADSSDDKKSIEINNDKDVAEMDNSWSDVDKSALRKELTDASNAGSLVKEAYLIVDSDWRDAPSESLHYPHHVIKDGELVVHKKGLEAAASRLMANDPNNEKAKKHLKKHYIELGLTMDFERSDNVDNKFAWTSEQLESELCMLLGTQKYISDWGYQYSAYWFVDYLPDQNIVIAEDSQNYYLVGMNYTVDGDKVSIDFNSCKRFKIEYVPMTLDDNDVLDNTQTFKLVTKEHMEYEIQKKLSEKFASQGNQLSDDVDNNLNNNVNPENADTGNNIPVDGTKNTPINQDQAMGDDFALELEELKAKYTALEEENKQLNEYKSTKEQEERSNAETELFAKFSDKLTEDEMKDVKEHSSEFSLEELEVKLFALVGKKAANGQFALNNKKPDGNKMPIFSDKSEEAPYGGLVEKYAQNK